jgi:magnesium-protoporphyrin O-methyltransferase
MNLMSYERRREQIEHYFDRTAADTWAKLTSDEPVSGIRQTVREGRDQMRATILSWLPQDLHGKRLLDAGCGTGALALEAARRGAEVVAMDLSPTLVDLASERVAGEQMAGQIDFKVGDMRQASLGEFDHIVAMDSLIHYDPVDGMQTLESMAKTVRASIIFTFAPRTPLLALMHSLGQFFPRGDRSPAIVPISEKGLARDIQGSGELQDWRSARSHRVNRGFYISQAQEIVRL